MKNLFFVLIALFVLVNAGGCSRIFQPQQPQEDTYQSTGTITGYDYRKCLCCSGAFITIEGTQYIIEKLPDNHGLVLEEGNYPISVALDWHRVTGACESFNRIIVDRIKKQ